MQDNKIDEITGLPTRILDAYQKNTGAKDITDNRQGLFNTAEPGGESDSSFQSLDFENLDSYTKRGFNPIYGADNSDLRAQRQDITDKWANGIVKGVGTALTSATESTAGLLYGLGAAIGTIGSDKSAINALYDNDFSRTLDSFNKQLAEAMPNYYRTNEENRSLLGSLGTANFWSDKFLNGAGYAAGAMVTGLGLAKLNMFGKLAGAGKLVGLSEEAIKADVALTKLANSVKFANRAEFAFNSVLMSTGESAAEARQAKDETKQRLLNDILKSGRQPTQEELKEIEDLSDAAGNTAYGLNLIITGGTNALQFGKMLGGGYNANKLALNDVRKKVTKEGVEELGEDGLSILEGVTKTVGKERAKKFGIGFLEEGGQEGLQSSTQFAVSDYYGRKFDKDNPNHDLFTSGIEGLVNTLTTKQGWESILLGGLLGGPMGLHGVAKETKDSNDRTAKAVELINNSSVLGGLKNKVENSIQEASYQKAKDAALERGDIAEYKNLEFQERKSYIKKVIESGGFDLLMDKLESTKGMAPAEFKKAFGIKEDYKLNPKSTIGDTEADVHNHIDEIKKKAVKLKDTYDKIQLAFPFKGSTKEELLSHKILTETLWNASTNIDNIDDREKQIAQHISELTNGTVNVFTGVNQLALREEFGDKYQEEFDKRFEANLKNITNPLIKNEVIAAKKDIDKLAKEREHYIDSYNKLVNSKEEVKKIEAKLEEQIKEIQKQELKKKAKLDEFQEGDFADVEVPISKNGVETGETRKFRGQVRKNNKGQLVVYDSNLQNDHPLSNLIDLHEAGKGSLKRITKR